MILTQSKASPAEGSVRHIIMLFGLAGLVVWAFCSILNREAMLGDPDIWWHIRTGAWIWLNGALPTTDPFSHSFAGRPWIAKEWLSQLIFFWAHNAGGWNGVMLVSGAAVGLSTWLLFRAVVQSLSPLPALISTMLAMLIALPSLAARPHILTLPLLIVWTQLVFGASERAQAPRPLWLAIIVLWANLHAGFTMAFVIAGFAFLNLIEKHPGGWRALAPKWIAFLVLCPLASLVHPYGWQPLLASWWAVFPADKALAIMEWGPFNPTEQPLLEIGLLLILLMVLLSGFRLGLVKAVLLILLFHLFRVHVRFVFYFTPVVAIFTAPDIARQFPRLSVEDWSRAPRDGVEEALARHYRLASVVMVAAIVMLGVLQAVLRTAPDEKNSVVPAILFAKAHGLTGNVLNDYDFGGPLIYYGVPTFIDGRSDQLFRADEFSLKYSRGPADPAQLSAMLAKFGITWTLLRPSDPRVPALNAMPGWRRVYGDANAVIYERGAPDPRAER